MTEKIQAYLDKHLKAGHGFVLTPLTNSRVSHILCECGSRISLLANKRTIVQFDGQVVMHVHCSNPQCKHYGYGTPGLEVLINTEIPA